MLNFDFLITNIPYHTAQMSLLLAADENVESESESMG